MATPVTLANVYTAIAEYSVIANPTIKWRNSYDFHSAIAPTGSADIVAAIASFAPGMIFSENQLDKIKVYNWAKGTQPYPDGLPILEIDYGTAGVAHTAWVMTDETDQAGNEVCLRVDKDHSGIGRPGRFFFRNLLPMSQLGALDGQGWHLVGGSPFTQAHFETWLTTSGVVNYLAGHIDPTTQQGFATVQYSSKAHVVHGYNYDSNWVMIGPTTNKATRKSKR